MKKFKQMIMPMAAGMLFLSLSACESLYDDQSPLAAQDTSGGARSVPALYDSWAGEDALLTVAEWDAAVDRLFGEEDVNLAVARWDDDANGVISPVEFEEAVANDDRFDAVLR